MRRYSEAVKAVAERGMRRPPPQTERRSNLNRAGLHIVTLYNLRKAWRLQGEVVPAPRKDPDGWSAVDKFKVALETAELNVTELSAYCLERRLYSEQLEKLCTKGQREIKALYAKDSPQQW